MFADDIAIRRYAERGNTIVHWTEFDRGGHFAAMEVPDLLVRRRARVLRRWSADAAGPAGGSPIRHSLT